MTELDDIELEVALPKRPAMIDKNSTPRRQRKKKKRTISIEPMDKNTMENTMQRTSATFEKLERAVVQKAKTSTTKPRSVVGFGFTHQLRQKLPASCTELSMEINEVSRSWVDDCCRAR